MHVAGTIMFVAMEIYAGLLVCSAISLGAAAPVDLQAKYPFSAVLFNQQGQYYGLHWNFTRSSESIYFAVNVSTTGWVGFGLSPNGQMPDSDVVIGWVSNTGESYFHDRYAQGRFLPPIDTVSQDWFLTNSEEANGYTVLEFSRNFTSCDPQDLDITPSTARVVWSFNVNDPTDPSGADAMRHNYQGSRSINLIGGNPGRSTAAASGDKPHLQITVTNVTIPTDSTTYWCASFRLPDALINTTHFINRINPTITPHPRTFVHHMLAYLCSSPLSEEDVGASAPCREVSNDVSRCRRDALVGAWAVGGEDFVYPEGIAFPVGGTGQEHFLVMEMHYDNPNMTEGVVDNSGFKFFYTTEEPEQRAGVIFLGHAVVPSMVIPPRTQNYTIAGICPADCTSRFIPEEGIRIFANGLHTHLIGRALTIQHFRQNTKCNVLEELEPIDQNLNYDFNFQQLTFLPREHIVLPGDVLVLKCDYSSLENARATLGGESTLEEMCLSFLYYYPKPPDGSSLSVCVSLPDGETAFTDFFLFLQRTNPEAAQRLLNPNQTMAAFNELDWAGNPALARSLQDSVLQSQVLGFCGPEMGAGAVQEGVSLPVTNCSYERPPDVCRDSTLTTTATTDRISGTVSLIDMGTCFFVLVPSAILSSLLQ